jgi:hypothetical protein
MEVIYKKGNDEMGRIRYVDLYLIDISIRDIDMKELVSIDPDDDNDVGTWYWVACSIEYHRDLFRGYTLNPSVARMYAEFIDSVIGEYVDIEINSIQVPDKLSDEGYSQLAASYYNEVSDKSDEVYAPYLEYASKISVLNTHSELTLITTDYMMEYMDETFGYGNILEDIVFPLTGICKYIKPMDEEPVKEFRQLLLDSIIPLVEDLFNKNSRCTIDYFGLVYYFIKTMKFTD